MNSYRLVGIDKGSDRIATDNHKNKYQYDTDTLRDRVMTDQLGLWNQSHKTTQRQH